MLEDVKILTSPDKAVVEKFIMEYSDKGYYKSEVKTDVIYDSFQFSGAYKIYYTIIMVKYKEEPIENLLDNNPEQNATEVGGGGELPTITEQIHSKKGGRSKEGKNPEKEMPMATDSSSVHEGE